jgi:hypothetical protein
MDSIDKEYYGFKNGYDNGLKNKSNIPIKPYNILYDMTGIFSIYIDNMISKNNIKFK